MKPNKKWREFLNELVEDIDKKDLITTEEIEESYKKGLKDGEEKAKSFYLEQIQNLMNFLNKIKENIETKIDERMKEIEKNLLQFSILLIKKILQIEVSEKSTEIIKSHINSIIEKFKINFKIEVFLSPDDYEVLKDYTGDGKFIMRVDNSLKKGNFYIKTNEINLLYNPEITIKDFEERLNDFKSY